MNRPTQAKYCPRCHAMNFLDAETCHHCGHEFRTGVASPPPSEDTFNKTQMFMLPPLVRGPEARTETPAGGGRGPGILAAKFAGIVARLSLLRSSPLLLIIGVLVVIIVALIYGVILTLR